MWFCRVIHRNHTRKGTSRVCWLRKVKRLPVLFAVEEEIPLIAFEHWPGDLDGFAQAVFIGPLDEKAEIDLAAAYRVLGVAPHLESVQVFAHKQFHRSLRRGLRLALLLYASHHSTPMCRASPLPLGLGMGTTTTGFCGMPLASASLYMRFPLFPEKPPSARVVAGDSSLRPPPDAPQTWPRLDPDRCASSPDTHLAAQTGHPHPAQLSVPVLRLGFAP